MLNFLLFGDFEVNKSMYNKEDFLQKKWMAYSWLCLDKFTLEEGLTPLHISCTLGENTIFKILLKLINHKLKY
jgi:hypothetical protein